MDWKELKTLVKEEPERVRELVRRISTPQRDTTLTYPDQIIAYFGQSLLTNDSEERLVHAMDQAYSEENYAEALAQAEKVLAVNPVNIKALIRAAYAKPTCVRRATSRTLTRRVRATTPGPSVCSIR